jgi:hypothetical protein
LALGHANKLSYVSPTNQSATTPEKRHGQRSNAKQQGKEEAEAGQEKVKGLSPRRLGTLCISR